MIVREITPKDYEFLLELDKKVYPTEFPVTEDIVASWYQKNPEFGLIFEEGLNIEGMCIAIPLNRNGWEGLTSGKLLESELDENTIYDSARDDEMGIHIYHIEKFDYEKKDFHKKALKGLSKLISSMKGENPKFKVIGFSALCVTLQGIELFYNKFNCGEKEFLNNEHILEKGNRKIVIESDSNSEIEDKISQGYEYVNRCKMLITSPGEISVVWKYF